MRVPIASIAVSLAGFLAGYVAFHPGWRKAAPLTNGTESSFRETARALADGGLLEKATPGERVGWLLEVCNQPTGFARDFALYEAIQRLLPADFLVAFGQLESLGMALEKMPQDARQGLAREAVIMTITDNVKAPTAIEFRNPRPRQGVTFTEDCKSKKWTAKRGPASYHDYDPNI